MAAPTLLVAEDDDRFRAALVLRLEASGYRVIQAADGESAMLLASQERPDMLILNVRMPYTDGLTALDEVDETDALRDCPVVYIAGDGRPRARDAAHSRGAVWLFHKPVNTIEVLALVEQLVGPATGTRVDHAAPVNQARLPDRGG